MGGFYTSGRSPVVCDCHGRTDVGVEERVAAIIRNSYASGEHAKVNKARLTRQRGLYAYAIIGVVPPGPTPTHTVEIDRILSGEGVV